MNIKNIQLKDNIVLAPMAGVTDAAYRGICLDMGASLVTTEMISDKGLLFKNKKTLDMININDNEHPIAIQLFGSEAKSILDAAKLVLEYSKPDMIDLNMGCPMRKIVQNGSGSALLKDPDKIYTIVRTLTDNLDIPISVKIRAGWDHQSINCDKVAKILEKAKASLITIHGRCRSDFYEGVANLDYIKMVKDSVSIPVCGNGDVKDIKSYKHMMEYTGCDMVAIGRAALGNPWIFKELTSYNSNLSYIPLTKEEVLDMILKHTQELIKINGEHVASILMRTHAAWYLKNLAGTKKYKVLITACSTYQDIVNIVNDIQSDNNVYINNRK